MRAVAFQEKVPQAPFPSVVSIFPEGKYVSEGVWGAQPPTNNPTSTTYYG